MTTVLSSHVAPSLEAETLAPFYQLIPGKLSAVISKKKEQEQNVIRLSVTRPLKAGSTIYQGNRML